MLRALDEGLEQSWKDIVTEQSPGIFTFELFSEYFCNLLVEEIDCFEATTLPRRRPNTMNVSGKHQNDKKRVLLYITKTLFILR
jgi:hypothetical protein